MKKSEGTSLKSEGINDDESIYHKIRCTYQELLGDLVLTDRGISFLEIKGMLGQGCERLHQFDFDEIRRIRTKKKKSGIFRYSIEIGYRTKSSESETNHYSCEEYKAALFLAFFERQKLLLKTPTEISSTIQSLSTFKRNADLIKVAKNSKMRPYFFAFALDKIESEILSQLEQRFDVDLFEVSKNKEMHSLVALLHESDPKKIPLDQVYNTVTDLTTNLISRGELDGKVTELGRYISSKALERISGPFEILADFETIFTRLHEKGLLIWALECPACSRKIKYPKKGKAITCDFCKEPIHARDVLQKFLNVL
ncbi:MAG: hypothetical protein ACFFEE_00525 [Candidatus Thorarchaeota archaeon]